VRRIEIVGLNAWYGNQHVLEDITLTIEPNEVTAFIGPSGSGKSTLLRAINRLHEESPSARLTGTVCFDGADIYADGVEAASIRRTAGLVAQNPSPFPTMSIVENAICGLRFNGIRKRAVLNEQAERVLRLVGLWDDVADRLHQPAKGLSSGQQQRLCIARAIAVEPEILLMDEPSSALDPVSTLFIEQLLKDLTEHFTIVVVTHNLQQAARISEKTALLSADRSGGPGRLVEAAPTVRLFTEPASERTEAYLTGRMG
jgi:phosphate transport system ATP-binding protein